MKLDKKTLALYAVTDRTHLGKNSLLNQTKSAIEGGATFVQLREKKLDEESFLKEAKELKKLCKSKNIPFVINDNISVAKKVNADGVHIGQGDIHARKARELIGKDKILGVSAQTVKQAIEAEKNGADYLGVGSVFPTNSKKDAEYVSLKTLKEISETVKIPVIAIGGITEENISLLRGSGISGIAVISAIFSSNNPKLAAENLYRLLKKEILND